MNRFSKRMTWITLGSLLIGASLVATTWLGSHHELEHSSLAPEHSKPNPISFYEMLGVTGGTNWDAHSKPNPAKGIFRNARSFHLMEIDYRYLTNPASYNVQICSADCDNVNCYPSDECSLPEGPYSKSTFAYYKARYCGKWKPNFDTIYASLEAITPYFKDKRCQSGGFEWKSWPDKWYTAEEWGVDTSRIRQNARHYAYAFAASFCPADTAMDCVVNVLEIGNEPWGDPGKTAFHALSRGMIDGIKDYYQSDNPKDWRMKISTAAFQADIPNSKILDYIEEMVPFDIRSYFDYISIHPYAFNANNELIETPESKEGKFLRIKNFERWRQEKMPHANLNVTEYGWNSDDKGEKFSGVGEEGQAIYLNRANLILARYGVHKAFIYELFDQPHVDLFNSTGLITRSNKSKKKSFLAIEKFQKLLGEKIFLKALIENSNPKNGCYAYILGKKDGTPTDLVLWQPSAVDKKEPSYLLSDPYQIELPNVNIRFDSNKRLQYLDWTKEYLDTEKLIAFDTIHPNRLAIRVSSKPLVIPLKANGVRYNKAGDLEEIEVDVAEEEPTEGEANNCTSIAFSNYFEMGVRANQQYFLSKEKMTWEKAKMSCETKESSLVEITSVEENKWLVQAMKKEGISTAFIGMNDFEEDNHFKWIHSGEPSFTAFSDKARGNAGQEVVYLGAWSDGLWYSTSTITEKHHVCVIRCRTL